MVPEKHINGDAENIAATKPNTNDHTINDENDENDENDVNLHVVVDVENAAKLVDDKYNFIFTPLEYSKV